MEVAAYVAGYAKAVIAWTLLHAGAAKMREAAPPDFLSLAPWGRVGAWRVLAGTELGLGLGPGFVTHQRYAVYHAMLLWIFLAGDARYGAALGVCFALARAAPVIGVAVSKHPDWAQRLPRVLLTLPLIAHRLAAVLLAGAGIELLSASRLTAQLGFHF